MKTIEEQIDYIRHQFIENPPESTAEFFLVDKNQLITYMKRLEHKLAELYSLIDEMGSK